MSNVLQTLFNTNHELPDLQVIVILAILAIVAPSVAKYLHQRRSSYSFISFTSFLFEETPKARSECCGLLVLRLSSLRSL